MQDAAAQLANPPVLRMRSLCKTYGSGETAVHALRDVGLDVRSGEFIVLLGASGSGKSTLLNILGGLDVPTSGEVEFVGHRISGATDAELTLYRREHVGFVFQFYNLIPSLTVRENVALVTDIASNPMPVDEALALVALTPRSDHFPSQLSGGEQQRVAIARAIVKRPDLLLCDEPTGAIEEDGRTRLLERYTVSAPVAARLARITLREGDRVSALGSEEQRVNIVIDVPQPPPAWRGMGDGFRVGVRIITASVDQAVLVPVGALFPHQAGMAVYRVDGRKARLQPVQVADRNATVAWVGGGVTPGQTVILYPAAAVAAGRTVKIRAP